MRDALETARALLEALEKNHVFGTKQLRERLDLLGRAMLAVELRAPVDEEDDDVVALTNVAIALRDDARAMRRRHRVVQRMVTAMMD